MQAKSGYNLLQNTSGTAVSHYFIQVSMALLWVSRFFKYQIPIFDFEYVSEYNF